MKKQVIGTCPHLHISDKTWARIQALAFLVLYSYPYVVCLYHQRSFKTLKRKVTLLNSGLNNGGRLRYGIRVKTKDKKVKAFC
jgi:hypothetical protein